MQEADSMSNIEVKHLKLIKTIAATENLTRAAKRLYITQPALSRQLIDIESRLETNLFVRTKKRMILTREGERLLQAANRILHDLETVELDISKIVNGETGRLNIGVQCIFCFQWLPGVMQAFQSRYPKVDLAINSSPTLFEDIVAQKIDLGISAGLPDHAGIKTKKLFADELAIVMAPKHPLSTKRFLAAEDFIGIKLIAPVEKSHNLFYEAILKPAGIALQQYMVVDQPQAVMELVKAGIGISMAPKWAVSSQLSSGQLHAASFTAKGIWLKWRVAYLQNGRMPAYKQKFIHLMTAQGLPSASSM
jgi:LysR family transcriptional regulator for metE and metH